MELYFLDESFAVIDGPIDDALYAEWDERFFEVGTFVIRLPRDTFSRACRAVYVEAVSESGVRYGGRVEYLSSGEDGECEMRGRLFESLISDVVLHGGGLYTGTLSDVLREVLEENLAHTPVQLDEDFCRIEDEVTLAPAWQNLAEWLHSTLRPYGASFSVKLRGGVPTLRIEVGRDLTTDGGSGYSRAVFSTSFGNIGGVEYERDARDMRNCAYICGSDGYVATVDCSGGGARREIYKNAADVVRSRFESEDEYVAALVRRGMEVLARCTEDVHVSAECDGGAGLEYGVDYALGDVCDVADAQLALSFALRVTGAVTVYENGSATIRPTFGDETGLIKKLRSAE